MKFVPVLAVLLLPQSGSAPPFAAGLAAYRAGDYAAAQTAFAAALTARGDEAPLELRIDAAMAALRLGRTADANAALAAVADTPSAPAEVPFLLGIAALQQAERAAAAARLPDAEPMAWMLAVRAARESVRWFGFADERRGGWPAALRNAERAVLRLQQFEAERTGDPAARRENAPKPEPPPPSSVAGAADESPAEPALAPAPLTAAELQQLQLRLRQREQEKLRRRREAHAAGAVAGEHDW